MGHAPSETARPQPRSTKSSTARSWWKTGVSAGDATVAPQVRSVSAPKKGRCVRVRRKCTTGMHAAVHGRGCLNAEKSGGEVNRG